MKNYFIHESSDIQTTHIGNNTRIWQYVVALSSSKIGSEVNICSHCFLDENVIIGDRVTIKFGVCVLDGVTIEDDVFIGPGVQFSNDKFPRSKIYPKEFLKTTIKKGASVGSGAVILPGIKVGMHAMVGAGAVVTQDVPPYAIVVGSPARIVGYIENSGSMSSNLNPGTNGSVVNLPSGDFEDVGVGGVLLTKLQYVSDMRGNLIVSEVAKNIPFEIKRIFSIVDVPSIKTRGEHAHKKCQQFLIMLKGSCAVSVDNGINRREIVMDSPKVGLYIPPMVWASQYKYSKDAVLLVLASHQYDESDYIRDYSDYLDVVNK